MFENNNQYKNPYSMYDPNYVQKLEENVRRLTEQNRQMADPTYSQYLKTSEVETDKFNNVMTYVLELVGAQWEKSELGQAFLKKHSPDSDRYKKYRDSLSKINITPKTKAPDEL